MVATAESGGVITTEHWSGRFGDLYTERQEMDTSERRHFLQAMIDEYKVTSVLEVGCNTGENLKHLTGPRAGVDVNSKALASVPEGIRTRRASATDLPFAENEYDLVMTIGVLIHIPPEDIERAMDEITRVARRFVFCCEYFGYDEVPYREGVLWRRSYGLLYENRGLRVIDRGHFKGEPWDRRRIDWWLLRV